MADEHFDFKPLAEHIDLIGKHFEANNETLSMDDIYTAKGALHAWINARNTTLTDLRVMYAVMHVMKNRKQYL